jgi:hypothetical protein
MPGKPLPPISAALSVDIVPAGISADLTIEVVPAERLLKFFAYDHLRADLQLVSMPFSMIARRLVETIPAGPERTVALRKLLEAKDAAVRAVAIPE